jgi:arylsulfatase A-like enzyme
MNPILAAALLVLSVDSLDHRYLEQADQFKLKIPNIRKLMKEGQWARGVMGIVPTVTWPSHTTIITGATAWEHGILNNQRPASEGGGYYWDVSLLKVPTLFDTAAKAGLKTGAITWPVTVNAPVTYNLPEYFKRRRGGAMDTESICSKAKPASLCADIAQRFPSFPQEWMDDRTRALAARWMLETGKADAVFVHFVDLDSEAHDNGPFTPQANAILEYTDELIGTLIAALPTGGRFVLVSDHGFEATTKTVNLLFASELAKVNGISPRGGMVLAETENAAQWLKSLPADYGIGREIPQDELKRLAPPLAGKRAFEPAPGVWFGFGTDALYGKTGETGKHGHWPTRYRAVYLEWGPGIPAGRLDEMPMTGEAARLAALLGLHHLRSRP